MARVELVPEAREDIADLDGSVRRLIFTKLLGLKEDPQRQGETLGGDPTGLRKLVVGDRRYRIIFQFTDNGDVAVLGVLASRVNGEVYEFAKARLALYAGRESVTEISALLDAAFGPVSLSDQIRNR